jgi:hypothetical protein
MLARRCSTSRFVFDAAAAAAAAEGRKGQGSLGKEIKIEHPSGLEISNLLLISLVYVCSESQRVRVKKLSEII